MNDFREQLLDRMIKIYGFEHPLVISFAEACECYVENETWDKMLEKLVDCHEKNPYFPDENS